MRQLFNSARLSIFVIAITILTHSFCRADSTPEQVPYTGAISRTWNLGKPLLEAGAWQWGFDLRTRYVHLDNVTDLGLNVYPDSANTFFRIRGRIWTAYGITSNLQAYARLTNESRIYLGCDDCRSKIDETIFENLYLETRNPLGLPLAVRLGRQDLFYGDGFLICDGGPLDGSRTAYVNGIVITGKIPLWAFDILAVYDPRMEEYLPRIRSQHRKIIENDELIAGVMLRRLDEDGRSRGFEPYFLYKEEARSQARSDIYTVGAAFEIPTGWARLSGEIAYQGGRPATIIRPEESLVARVETTSVTRIAGLGGKVSLSKRFKLAIPAQLTAGYLYLSGDDPKTRGKFEGWNPILGRWPKWSELYIYTLMLESDAQPMNQGIAYWQNLVSPYLKLAVLPTPYIRLDASYMWLDADKSVFFDRRLAGHTHRGELLTFRLSLNIEGIIGGHMLLEHFTPGDFYPEDAEAASFFRIELTRSLP